MFSGAMASDLTMAASGSDRSLSRTSSSLPRNTNVRGASCAAGEYRDWKAEGVTSKAKRIRKEC